MAGDHAASDPPRDPLAALPWKFYEPSAARAPREAWLARHPTLGAGVLVVCSGNDPWLPHGAPQRGVLCRPVAAENSTSPYLFTDLSAEELLTLEVVPLWLAPAFPLPGGG